jgi:hypothetical protein
LHEEGIVKGEFYSSLQFTGSITVPNSTCLDLRVPNWSVAVRGSFLSTGGFVGETGIFEEFDCGGSCLGYSTFYIDAAQANRLSGRTGCYFSYTDQGHRLWSAQGTWVADRQP